jgi:ABC-type sugar transport system substrate-binding protein
MILSACGPAAATEAPVVEPQPETTVIPTAVTPALPEGQFVAFVIRSQQDPYWEASRSAVEDKMLEYGIKAEFLGPEAENAETQQTIFANALIRKPAAILVAPSNPDGITDLINQATNAGIPVFTINTDAPNSSRAFYIGTDNALAGYELGKKFAESIGGKGSIAIFHGSFQSIVDGQRVDGFKKAIAEFPDIQIVETIETVLPADATVAAITPDFVLESHPDLVGIFSVTGASAAEVGTALKTKEKCGLIKVFGFGSVHQGVELMREGCIQSFASEKPYQMTSQAIDMMIAYLAGTTDQPKLTDIGVEIVTPETLEAFLKANN